MKQISLKPVASLVLALGLFGAGPALAQQSPIQLGTLTCTVEGSKTSIFGGSRDVNCDFAPTFANGQVATYEGTISNVGLDLGFHKVATLSWGVLAPSGATSPDVLSGTYVGTTLSGSVGVGFGGNVLFGGSQKTVSLQPVSLQLQTGLNATLGAVELKLNLVEPETDVSSAIEENTWGAEVTRGG